MENPCASSQLPASSFKQSDRLLTAYGLRLTAAIAGFLLPLQTIWILRPGTLGGVPWPLATIGVYASDVVLLIAAAFGVTKMFPPLPLGRGSACPPKPWRRWERGRGAHRLPVALALLVIVAIVNTRISVDPALSAVGWVRIIAFLLALVGLPAWPTSARRAFLGGFLVAMLGHVIIGLIQFFTLEAQPFTLLGIAAHNAWTLGDSVITAPGERWLRAYGGFPHPNVLGTALLVALISLTRWVSTPPRPPSQREVGKQQKPISPPHTGRGSERGWGIFIVHHSSFIILTFALVFSSSRAAWLGFVILLFVLARSRAAPEKDDRLKLEHAEDAGASHWSVRSLAGIGAIAFVAFLLVLWPLIAPRFTGSTPNEQRSLSERTNSIRDVVNVLPAALVSSGHGLHALPAWMYERYGSANPKFFQRHPEFFQPVHNVPFLMLTEFGGIGVLVFVLVLVLLFRLLFRSQRPYALRLTSYVSMWLALAPSLLFDHHLWSLPIGLALLFALAVAVSRTEEQPLADSPSS